MGFSRSLPELEDSLAGRASAFELLTDREYHQLVDRWQPVFRPLVEARNRRLSGPAHWEPPSPSFRKRFLFSGVGFLRSRTAEAVVPWPIGRWRLRTSMRSLFAS